MAASPRTSQHTDMVMSVCPSFAVFPSHAKLFLAPYSDTDYFSSYVNYWDDVYGVNMSCIRPKAVQWMVAEPYVENTEPKAVAVAKPIVILVRNSRE